MKNYPVINDQAALGGTLEALRQSAVEWGKALLVTDKKLHDVCVFLINQNKIVDGFQPNMDADTFARLRTSVIAAGRWFVTDEVNSFDVFQEGLIPEGLKIKNLDKSAINRIFEKPARPKPKKGRTGDISANTAREVYRQSHMRCMFKGCAKRLDEHSSTGEEGYFGYLAHIVPASEKGPRGNEAQPGECEQLVDDPSNIMLLCDECHRLVDRVSVSDFPRKVLNDMRRDFLLSAAKCLEYLAFVDAPVVEFLWPIGTDAVGIPSSKEIQKSLHPLGLRWNGNKHKIADRNPILHDTKTKEFWSIVPTLLKPTKNEFKALADQHPYIGLFAGGPMPALIALGVLLGNKTKIIPMLNARSSGGWCWLKEEAELNLFSVSGLEELSDSSDVVLKLNLTQKTNPQEEKGQQLEAQYGCGSIIIQAHQMSNECFAHPEEALSFQNEMTKLLTHLKSSCGIIRVHLLPCASNLACVHFGRSIEQYCPEVRVYDFLNEEDNTTSIYPVLDIIPGNEGAEIKSVTE